MIERWFLIFAVLLAGCSVDQPAGNVSASDRQLFVNNLRGLCGQSFAGKLVSTDEADADFRGVPMIMHVRDCEATVIRIPFHIGDDHSRTWVLTDLGDSLLLEHDHRHEDGSSDAVTMYGGQTAADQDGLSDNSEIGQNFPADEKTKALFIREGIEVSTQNTWRLEVQPGTLFAYQMSRPNRMFRVEFDLTEAVSAPPSAWGYE